MHRRALTRTEVESYKVSTAVFGDVVVGAAVHRFDRRCSELTHRTKGGAECTNICS